MLLGLQGAEKFIRIAFKVIEAGEQPIGIILVAPPGAGKSYLLTSFKGDGWVVCHDISGHGLETLMIEMSNRKTGYLVLPDMIRAFGRTNARNSLFAVLNVILEEGLTQIQRSDVKFRFNEPVKFGFIGAITTKEFLNRKKDMESVGLFSRCFVFSFKYTPEDTKRIVEYVSKNGLPKPDERIPLEVDEIKPVVVDEVAEYIKNLGHLLTRLKNESFPFRSIKLIRKLVKGSARYCKRNKATIEDIVQVYSFLPFLVYDATDLDYRILTYIGKETILEKKEYVDYDEMTKKAKMYSEETISKSLMNLHAKGFISIRKNKITYGRIFYGEEMREANSYSNKEFQDNTL